MGGNFDEKRDILLTADEYLEKLEPGLNSIVEYFREGEDAQALSIFTNVLEGISWLLDTFELTQDIQTDKIGDYGIMPFLEEMEEALQDIDYILLSDLIEYEILPIVQKWRAQVKNNLNV